MFAAIHRVITSAGWVLVAAVFFLVFIGTGIAALYMYLLRYLSPPEAMGAIAAGSAVIGLIAVLCAVRAMEPRPPQWEAALKEAVAKDPLGAAIGALAVGLIIESSPELGRLLNRVMARLTR